jgi:orotidine-5'-phosphate decarboxylase
MAFGKLIESIVKTNNPTVVGLDPRLELLPEFIKQAAYEEYGQTPEGAAEAVLRWGMGLIDALWDIVPAIKPQSAFYEQFGWAGIRALEQTVAYARKRGLYVIMDAKRGDIGSTMSAYAAAVLGEVQIGQSAYEPIGADALTVSGYLGSDCIDALLPLCDSRDRGVFVLVKTSNPSSGELQDRLLEGSPVYAAMGAMCEQWGSRTVHCYGYSAVGAVVGATYPRQLAELRKAMPTTFFLVPGYGAQGGTAADVAAAFDQRGLGAVVNSSRGIIAAYKRLGYPEQEYAAAARQAALDMQSDLLSHLPAITL